MKKILPLIILFCTCVLSAQTFIPTTTIMPWGATWKWKNNSTDLGTAWYASNYNDAAFSNGAAPLGYGGIDAGYFGLVIPAQAVATTIGSTGAAGGTNTATFYFRSTFNMSTSSYSVVQFKLRVDDGCAVYINGQMVSTTMTKYATASTTNSTVSTSTASLPFQLTAPWTYTSMTNDQTTDGQDLFTFTLSVTNTLLVNGTNTIAVEAHNRSNNSSDILWALQVEGGDMGAAPPPAPPAIVKGPYLVVGTPTSMVVRWETDVATDSKVLFGTNSASLTSVVTNTSSVTIHTMQINGLTPYTKYFYSIGSSTLVLQGDADNYFVTNPLPGTPGQYRFWVVGDCGNASTNQINCRNQYLAYNGNRVTNAMLLSGDNAYNSGTNTEYNNQFFGIYQNDALKKMTMYSAPGNHDYNNGASTATTVTYFTHFQTPTNGEAGGVPSNNPAYYSFDYGNVHFLSLDSYGTTGASQKMYDTTGAQVNWIKQDLAANNKKWTIAYWHHPPYTMGSHNSDTEGDLVNIRTRFIRILERNGVDMIITGHSHDYERTKLINGHYGNEASFNAATHNLSSSTGLYNGSANSCPYEKDSQNNKVGTVYVLSGSAGQLGGQQGSFPHNAMYYSNASNGGTFILDIEDNKLDAKWLCADGVIRDNFTMVKDVKTKQSYTVQPNQTVTLTASWPGNYVWSSSLTARSITASATSDSTIWVKDPNNCVTDTFKLKVLPTVSFTAAVPYCTTSPVQLNDLSTNNTTTWSWSVSPSGDASINNASSKNPLITFNAASVYTVTLISGNFHGSGIAYSKTVAVISGPTVSATSNTSAICLNQSLTLNANGASSYSWNTGENTSTINVTPTVTSIYAVVGTDGNGCIATANKTIVVNSLPVLTVSSIPVNGITCAGSTLTLNGNGANSYTWTGGISDGVAFTPTSNLTYTLTGTDNNGCQNTITQAVTINPLPALSVTADPVNAVVCNGSTLNLTASGAGSYAWSNGVTNAITFTPAASSVYTLTGTLNGCQSTITQSVTINSLPTLTITGTNAICLGQTATLSSGGASTYSWSTNAISNAISVAPTITTTYTVIGTGTNSCQNSDIKIITVNTLPTVQVVANPTNAIVCSGNTISLSGSGAINYAWSGGVSNASQFIPISNATHTVTGTDANGCQNTAIVSLTVNSNPTISIASASAICNGESATLTASGASSYTWNATSFNPVLIMSPAATSSYTVVGTNTNGCSGTITSTLIVNPQPTITANNGTICPGYSFTISPIGASTYTYSGGSNVVSPLFNTQYSVSGTSSLGCVSGTPVVLNINVTNTLTLSISGQTAICSGQNANLTATGANSYTWSTGATSNTISIAPTANTSYTVLGASPTCSNTKVYSLVVNSLPVVSIAATQTAVCVGKTVVLTANGSNSYMWNTGTSNNSISVSPQSNTTYTLTGYSASGCSSTSTQFVKVNSLPVVNAISSSTNFICAGETATLTATGGVNYLWNTGNTSNTIALSPTSTSSYTVNGTDLNGCENYASVTQSVSECSGIELMEFEQGQLNIYPNPSNGLFTIQTSHKGLLSIEIYNTVGQMIKKEKINEGLMFLDLKESKGIYFYTILINQRIVSTGKLIVE